MECLSGLRASARGATSDGASPPSNRHAQAATPGSVSVHPSPQQRRPPVVKLRRLFCAACCTAALAATTLPATALSPMLAGSMCAGGGAGWGTLKKPRASSNSAWLRGRRGGAAAQRSTSRKLTPTHPHLATHKHHPCTRQGSPGGAVTGRPHPGTAPELPPGQQLCDAAAAAAPALSRLQHIHLPCVHVLYPVALQSRWRDRAGRAAHLAS